MHPWAAAKSQLYTDSQVHPWAVAEPGFHGFVFQVQKNSDAYAIVIRDKTSIKMILVHNSSSIYIIFLKYMLGKLFFYPGNKTPGKVNLVSPLVIIEV